MTEPGGGRRVDVPLVLGLALVGLVILMLWSGGCMLNVFRGHGAGWPWGRMWPWEGWRLTPFGPLYPLFGVWGLIQVALALWVGVDANRRGANGVLWGLLVLFTSVVGLVVYLLVVPTLERNGRGPGVAAPAAAPPVEARCAQCGSGLRPEFRVCPRCGTATVGTCAACGRAQERGWKLCPYCGTRSEPPGDAPA